MAQNFNEVQAKVIAKAWKDPKFKKRLLENPKEVLKEMGFEVPADIKVIAQEEKQNEFHLYLPPAPGDLQSLSENELNMRAAAGTPLPPPSSPTAGCSF